MGAGAEGVDVEGVGDWRRLNGTCPFLGAGGGEFSKCVSLFVESEESLSSRMTNSVADGMNAGALARKRCPERVIPGFGDEMAVTISRESEEKEGMVGATCRGGRTVECIMVV